MLKISLVTSDTFFKEEYPGKSKALRFEFIRKVYWITNLVKINVNVILRGQSFQIVPIARI